MNEAPDKKASGRPGTQSAERWISRGTTLAIAGLILSASINGPIFGAITLVGLGAAVVGLHRYGRTGPDPLSSLTSQDSNRDVTA